MGIVTYLCVLVILSFLAGRGGRDRTAFIVASRKLPLWLCTFSLFATWFGGGTLLGVSGAAYEKGLLGVIADPFGASLCLFLAGLFYVRTMRRMSLLTVPDFFGHRFGTGAELLASICLIPAYVGWLASSLVAFGRILHWFGGMDPVVSVAGGAVLVFVYTASGGMRGVSATQAIQAVVVVSGLLVLLAAVVKAAGNWQLALEHLPTAHLRVYPEGSMRDWAWYIQAWVVIGLGNLPGQDLMQRAFSARDESVAQRSALLAGAMYLAVGLVPVMLGLLGRALLPRMAQPEELVLTLAQQYLGPIGLLLFVCALVSSVMSAAESAMLAASSVFVQNLGRRFAQQDRDDLLLRANRVAIPVFLVIALVLGLRFNNVYDLMVNSWSCLLVSLLVPLTAGLFWRRTSSRAAIASMLAGIGSWIVLSAAQSVYPADLLSAVVAFLTIAAVNLHAVASDRVFPWFEVWWCPAWIPRRRGERG